MLKEMCLSALAQADLKVLGRSRGFEPEILASRALLQHAFLSETGVSTVLATLTEAEILGLNFLQLKEEVSLDFFERIYTDLAGSKYYHSYTERFKPLFQRVKTQLIQRGILLFGTLSDYENDGPVLERRRFRFPKNFGPLLPAPFRARRVDSGSTVQFRQEVLRNKLAEILAPAEAPRKSEKGCWRLENGSLFFGGDPFRVERLKAWPIAQWEAAVPGPKGEGESLGAVSLLRYALSCLRPGEWMAASDLLPFWKMAIKGAKAPHPEAVCEEGYQCGCLEKTEQAGANCYRWPRTDPALEHAAPEQFLKIENAKSVSIQLEHTPLAGLEHVCEGCRLEIKNGALWASPDALKISHASNEALAGPVFGWLREQHAAFRDTLETVEKKKGRILLHENLLVARISALEVKVALEKKFGEPGQFVSLSREFAAFPRSLLPEIQSWMKKAGHVIKTINAEAACD